MTVDAARTYVFSACLLCLLASCAEGVRLRGDRSADPDSPPTGSDPTSGTSATFTLPTSESCAPAPDMDCAVASDGGWVDATVTDDGTAYVSWAVVINGAVTIWVARSPAPGAPLEGRTRLAATLPTTALSRTEKPTLDADGARVLVAQAGESLERHGDSKEVVLHVADAATLTFAEPILVGETSDHEDDFLEHAVVGLAPDGDAWVLWKRQEYGQHDVVMQARESNDWVPAMVSADLSKLHECSPFDLAFTAAGDALVAIRSNEDWEWLDTFMAIAPDGGDFGVPVRVSTESWEWQDICPFDGPRITATDDALVAVWTTQPTFGGHEVAWYSVSHDLGVSWSAQRPIEEIEDSSQYWPTITTVGATPWVTVDEFWEGTVLYSGSDQGFVRERTLETPDGPLDQAEIASGGGRTIVAGATELGSVWILDVPEATP